MRRLSSGTAGPSTPLRMCTVCVFPGPGRAAPSRLGRSQGPRRQPLPWPTCPPPDWPCPQAIEIDFTPPFRRISMCAGLEEALNVKLPADLDSEEARLFLVELVRRGGAWQPL